MNKTKVNFIVYFESPFWVGIFEKIENNKLSVSKITFGAEPNSQEIYNFINIHYYQLKFSPSVDTKFPDKKKSPKRIRREIDKQLKNNGIGTKSQQAIKLQQEQVKLEKKKYIKEQTKKSKIEKFQLKQEKKKQKHRGR